jgi:hypothetical protein
MAGGSATSKWSASHTAAPNGQHHRLVRSLPAPVRAILCLISVCEPFAEVKSHLQRLRGGELDDDAAGGVQ